MGRFLIPGLFLSLLAVVILSLGIGTLDVSVGAALIDWISSSLGGQELTQEALIVGEIRLPRTLLAVVVGAAMGISPLVGVPRWGRVPAPGVLLCGA